MSHLPDSGVSNPSIIAPSSQLKLLLMGTPGILAAGIPLSLNHLKAQALLYYLAANARSFTREHLAALLWGNAATNEALHSLRSSLYRLRQGLRAGGLEAVLVSEGENLGLQPAGFECDLLEFRRLAAQADEASLERAVALYRGPLLQGFSMPDAPGFDSWLQAEEARLSQEIFTCLDRLARAVEARSEWAAAIDYLQRMAGLDPLDEAVEQRLLRACLNQGEVGLALRQYRQFESRLRQELSLDPSPETQALLYDALRRQRGTELIPAAQPDNAAHQVLPLTGRERLLDQLIDISRSIQTGRGATVLVEGEAGIGKTRLIDEFIRRRLSGSTPWTVLQGSCSPFDDLLSYGPFLEAFENASVESLPDLPVELDPSLPDTRGRFSWRVLQTLRSLTHNQPLLMIIEDLQWANSSTLNLFGFLSMRLQRLPVMLVGSVQHADSIPALQRLVSVGRRRGDLTLLPLSPLTKAGVTSILRASSLDDASVEMLGDWLYDRSAGSPFLLNEILAQLRKEGLLQPFLEGWQLDASRWWNWRRGFELPETTHDLVAWRLADLPSAERHILDVLAVAGQPLAANVLSAIPGIPPDEFPALLDDLSARRLLIEPPGGRLALPHHLLRETLLHRLGSLNRRMIHRQLVAALEANMSWNDSTSLHQFAQHAVAGEDISRARRYGLAVLPDLPQAYMGADTLEFVHYLHDLLAPSATPSEMATLTQALGSLHLSLGHLESAADWLKRSLEWARKARDPFAQAAAHFEMSELALMANDFHKAMDNARAGLGELESASQLAPATPGSLMLVGRGRRLLGAAFAMEGQDLAEAEKHLQAAVAALRQTRNLEDLCAGLFELGNIAAQRGELQGALDFYDEAARTAEEGNIYYYLALSRNNYAYHSLLLGKIEQAEASAVQGVKVAEAHDLLAALLHLYSTRGEIHLYLAEWDEAQESFQHGLALAEELGSLERKAGYHGGLALAARGRGDLESAAALLEEALSFIREAGYWHLRTRLQIWLAETLFLQGRFDAAAAPLGEALDIAREHHRTLLLVQGQRLQAALLAESGNWQAADVLFTEIRQAAESLGVELEVGRVEAVWALAAVRFGPGDASAQEHLDAARRIFKAFNARAELASLPE